MERIGADATLGAIGGHGGQPAFDNDDREARARADRRWAVHAERAGRIDV